MKIIDIDGEETQLTWYEFVRQTFFTIVLTITIVLLCLFAVGITQAQVEKAVTIDSQIESITAFVVDFEETNKLPSGKYVSRDFTDYGYGGYRVDEYETPCIDGFNPPVCYGYNIVFQDDLGRELIQGTGKLQINTDWVEVNLVESVSSTISI